MNLLLDILLYAAVGCSEWYLALRRTLACARGEKSLLVVIVFIENILGLWVLSNFVRNNDWLVAISYSAGGALGALLVNCTNPGEKKTPCATCASSPADTDTELPPVPSPEDALPAR